MVQKIPLSAFLVADLNNNEFSNSQKIDISDHNKFGRFALNLNDIKIIYPYMLYIQLIRSKDINQLKENIGFLMTKRNLNEIESIIYNAILMNEINFKTNILDYIDNITVTKNLADLNRNDFNVAFTMYKKLEMKDEIISLLIENKMFKNLKTFIKDEGITPNWKNIFKIIISNCTKNVGLFLYFLSEQSLGLYNINEIISILSENQMKSLCINFLFSNPKINIMNSKYKNILFKMILKEKVIWGYYFLKHNYFSKNVEFIEKLDYGNPIFKSKLNEIIKKDNINLIFSIPYQNFRNYFEKGDIISASKVLILNPKICLMLANSKPFIKSLISNGKNEIILSIYYVLKKKSISVLNIIDPIDFPVVCKNCSYPIISVYGNHPNAVYKGIKNDDSPLRIIIERNDPDLLYDCLRDLKKLIIAEKDNFALLCFLIDNELLLDNLWIIAEAFELTNYDLFRAASYWRQKYPSLKIPSIISNAERNYIQNVNYQIINHKIEMNSNQRIQDLFSLDILQGSNKLFNFLKLRKADVDKHGEGIKKVIDLNSKYILVQLPCLFLENTKYFQSSNLKMEIANIGSDALGEGPVQDMFDKYFEQLSKIKVFNGDKVSILPCSVEQFANNKEKIKELEIIFYGLGVIFLKILIDMRNMKGINSQDNSFLINEFHPWFFNALCWKFDSNPKEIYKELFFFDPRIRETILNDLREYKDIPKAISSGESFFKCREIFFKAIHDGFQLNYRPNFLPKSFKQPMELSRKSLINFYDLINSIPPLSIQFIILGPQKISAKSFLSRIIFEAYNHVSTNDYSTDELVDFDDNSQNYKYDIFIKAKEIFENLIHKLCDEDMQVLMKRFLNYVYGSYTLSPLVTDKWKFCIDFSYKANIMYSFECDRVTKFPVFTTEDELRNIILTTLNNYEIDPITRDVNPAMHPHDI